MAVAQPDAVLWQAPVGQRHCGILRQLLLSHLHSLPLQSADEETFEIETDVVLAATGKPGQRRALRVLPSCCSVQLKGRQLPCRQTVAVAELRR